MGIFLIFKQLHIDAAALAIGWLAMATLSRQHHAKKLTFATACFPGLGANSSSPRLTLHHPFDNARKIADLEVAIGAVESMLDAAQ